MSQRIDYVKVSFRGNVEQVLPWTEKQRNIVLDWTEPRKLEVGKFCNTDRFFDFVQKGWVTVFEVWGEAADFYFLMMNMSDRGSVMRIDYRMDVEDLAIRLATIEHVARANARRTRRTVTRIDSPPRTKKGDRDAGGQFLAVGAKGTEKRVTVYKRGNEPHALEVQFGKGVPFLIHQEAVRKYLANDNQSYYDTYMAIAWERFKETAAAYLHFPVEVLTGQEQMPHNQEALDYQESMLAQFDHFWANMDTDAKKVVASKVVTEMERADIIIEDLEEPDGLWPTGLYGE